jgi:hypothetical protein
MFGVCDSGCAAAAWWNLEDRSYHENEFGFM